MFIKINLFQFPENTHEIDFGTYVALLKKERKQSVLPAKNEFYLGYIEKENPVLVGARFYGFG